MFTILWGAEHYGEFVTKTAAQAYLESAGWTVTDIDQTEWKLDQYSAEIVPLIPKHSLSELPNKG